MHRLDLRRVLRYLFTGGTAFAIDFGLLALFKSVFGFPAWLAATLAFIISTVFAFLGQKYFTYASKAPTGRSLMRYLILLAANTAFTAVVVQGFDSFLGLYLLGKVVSTAITTVWNYPLMGHWVYREDAVVAGSTVAALAEPVESVNSEEPVNPYVTGGDNA